jgi:hypothetical protein
MKDFGDNKMHGATINYKGFLGLINSASVGE